ncbi:hypothetical protein BC937DRAFT_89628 [Endogone sp. FLAS-F59071]|nr:hypothetical protein BC937DRAFT_89628 [Endogone sp. FLAS-F59071]|eukprot:RUS22355.1 hypothetical protein BC937DRAFT_89628 [Endogone sp. FLAS-F59071]
MPVIQYDELFLRRRLLVRPVSEDYGILQGERDAGKRGFGLLPRLESLCDRREIMGGPFFRFRPKTIAMTVC